MDQENENEIHDKSSWMNKRHPWLTIVLKITKLCVVGESKIEWLSAGSVCAFNWFLSYKIHAYLYVGERKKAQQQRSSSARSSEVATLDDNNKTIDERSSGLHALNDMIHYLNIPGSTNRDQHHQTLLSQTIINPVNAPRQQVEAFGKFACKFSMLFYLIIDESIHLFGCSRESRSRTVQRSSKLEDHFGNFTAY